MRAKQIRACSGSSPLPKPRVAVISRSPSTSARRSQRRAAPATSATRARAPGHGALRSRFPATSRARSHRPSRGSSWPIGRRSLVAMLRGSVAAPRSARRSPSYGILAAATDAEVKRWVKALEDTGALLEAETKDGFKVLQVVPDVDLPALGPRPAGPTDEAIVQRLRAWRLERSRADEVPAFVVLHDATLRELAAVKPSSMSELADGEGLRARQARALRRRSSRNAHTAVTRHAATIPRLGLRQSTKASRRGVGFESCACWQCWSC